MISCDSNRQDKINRPKDNAEKQLAIVIQAVLNKVTFQRQNINQDKQMEKQKE